MTSLPFTAAIAGLICAVSVTAVPLPPVIYDNTHPFHHPSAQELDELILPPGFSIDYYCEGNLEGARSMALSPSGVLYVGTRSDPNTVYAVTPGCADVFVVASGMVSPNGVAFHEGDLYVAEIPNVWVFRNIEDDLANPPTPELVFDGYPTDTHHGHKYLGFGPDGRLYTPVGAPCNICDEDEPYATITSLDVHNASAGYDIVALGVRNSVGFDWDKQGRLWFTENGRDFLGNYLPPDEVNFVSNPASEPPHYGYPFCHGVNVTDPEFNENGQIDCGTFVPPVAELPAHVAALGMKFYTGSMFPAAFADKIILAEHGSWNKQDFPIGYRVSVVDPETGDYSQLIEGFLRPDGTKWGRPVDVAVFADDSLLVSDDLNNSVYRVVYTA